MSLKTRNRKAQVDKCSVITTTINVPFLETPLAGDILVKLPVVTKLHCEDMCLRHPHCKGFNYNNQLKECDLLRKVYREQDREMSLAIRSFMKQVLFFCFTHIQDAHFTLQFPRVPKIKVQEKSQISFCKILKNK